jgi:hypothetical protein
MLEFIAAIVALVFARAIWDFVKVRAKACNQLPICWLFEVVGLTLALALIATPFVVVAILYLVSR